MKPSRICRNPKCAELAPAYRGGFYRYGLCPSCQYELNRGLKIGAVIGGAVVVILRFIFT